MVDFQTIVAFLCEFGPLEIMAHDRSRVRRVEEIRGETVDGIVDRLHELKDGPETWKYSITIKPSR